jgi:hypothetical protein
MIGYYTKEWETLAPRIVDRWCTSFSGNTQLQLPSTLGKNHGSLLNYTNNANDAYVTSGDRLALFFDNSNDQVQMPSIPEIRTGPFTVSLWYYPFSVSGLNQIFAQWSFSGFGSIAFRNGTSLAWQVGNRVTTGAVFTANAWHHIVCFRQADGTLRAMVNGVLDSGSIPAANQFSTEPFLLGGPVGGAGTGAGNCQMDDLITFGAALTVQESRFIFEQGRGGGLLYEPPRRKTYFVPASGWKPYWFRNQQRMVGGGIR